MRFGTVSLGWTRRSGYGKAARGSASCVVAVGERFGEVWSVEVRNDKAVGERSGLDGFGELGRINGMVRLGF